MLGLILVAAAIPFQLIDHRIFVRAYVNSVGPFAMIVDTGSSGMAIAPDVARRLNIAATPEGRVTGAGSGSAPAAGAVIRELRLGDTEYRSVRADVIDLSPVQRAIGFKHLDGIIGYDQLRRYRVFVDMDRRQLTLSLGNVVAPTNSTVTPFVLGDGGTIVVPASVDGVHGDFLVDTGDRSQLTLFRAFAQANDFYGFAPVHNVVTGYGIGGPIYSDLLRTTVQAFGATVGGVVTRASRDRGGAFAESSLAGSIGNGFLEHFNTIFDYPHRTIVTWPVAAPIASTSLFHEPEIPETSATAALPRHAIFGAAAVQKPAGVTVSYVAATGPAAAAGLRAGDVLRSVGDRPISVAADFYQAIHDLRAGQTIVVNVLRDGNPLKLAATLGAAPDERDTDVTTQYQTVVVDDTLRRSILTFPTGATHRLPALMIVGGIGCFSVDAASYPQDAYMRLAHDVSRAGFVTMRLEKSGVGDSQGPPCTNVDFEAEERGYSAALAALQNDPMVDPARIFVFGHSIGTVIAPRLAQHVAGIIVAEAVGRDWPEYEIRNTRRELELGGDTPAAVDLALIEKAQCMQRLLFEHQPEAEIEQSMPACRVHNGVYPVAASYVQQVAGLNIIEPWSNIDVPVLAVYGTSDFVTELADHQRIVDVVNRAHPGMASLVTIDGMTHLLTRDATPQQAMIDFNAGTALPYDTDLSHAVITWLHTHVSP